MSTSKGVPALDETMEGIPIKDPAYFTSERDWSLMSFLYYRHKCNDFLPSKAQEHDRYACNLMDIIGYEEAPTSIVKRAGKWMGLKGNSPLDGVTACIQSPTLPVYGWEVHELRLVVVLSCVNGFLSGWKWTGLKGDSPLDGVTACIQSPTLPVYGWEVHELWLVVVLSLQLELH
ncbi:1231_t:CDS:2 [Paraglomus brasilianum]|uniref:1231_t:CDS:1 n=1 Tax=Paraglomus brasilianum TaxID=144538 RepID=A0A9N9BV88_9GLOM|nr:1231_t:CDS:2 [Paraglomus brasilianum]